jgi:hypothetical protein
MLNGIYLWQRTDVTMQLRYPRPQAQYFPFAPHNLDLAGRRI